MPKARQLSGAAFEARLAAHMQRYMKIMKGDSTSVLLTEQDQDLERVFAEGTFDFDVSDNVAAWDYVEKAEQQQPVTPPPPPSAAKKPRRSALEDDLRSDIFDDSTDPFFADGEGGELLLPPPQSWSVRLKESKTSTPNGPTRRTKRGGEETPSRRKLQEKFSAEDARKLFKEADPVCAASQERTGAEHPTMTEEELENFFEDSDFPLSQQQQENLFTATQLTSMLGHTQGRKTPQGAAEETVVVPEQGVMSRSSEDLFGSEDDDVFLNIPDDGGVEGSSTATTVKEEEENGEKIRLASV